MSNLNQFRGGGQLPIGGNLPIFQGSVSVTQGSQEFLRCGSMKTYDSSYASVYAAAPQLGVFGTPANTATTIYDYSYAGALVHFAGRYMLFPKATGGTSPQQSATLAGLASSTTVTNGNNQQPTTRPSVIGVGNGYLVAPSTATVAPVYTTDGIAFTAVGGSWATNDQRNVIIYMAGAGWIAIGVNTNNTNYGYISNINPTGTWTLTAATNISSVCTAGAYGNSIAVFITNATIYGITNKLFTISSPGSAPVDRTANLPGLVASDTLGALTFANGYFYICTTTTKAWRSTDGITWTVATHPNTSNVGIAETGASITAETVTDVVGNGTTLVAISNNRAYYLRVSTDAGITWKSVQITGVAANQVTAPASINYCNGQWTVFTSSATGNTTNVVVLSPDFATPDYIGQQTPLYVGQYVRIK